jgi:alpha-D-xyloside xylohydrolase
MVYYDKLRYRLMPYIYSLAGMTWFNDYTIMRALVMDFNGDPVVNNIGDQYLFGPSLMVAPVYEYKARSRQVYFPANTGWYDFYSGKYLDGGRTLTVDAPYEQMPLFVREGSIVPFGPAVQYATEANDGTLTLFVYTGKDADFTIYEDEAVTTLRKGRLLPHPVHYDDQSKTLTIGDRQGNPRHGPGTEYPDRLGWKRQTGKSSSGLSGRSDRYVLRKTIAIVRISDR